MTTHIYGFPIIYM